MRKPRSSQADVVLDGGVGRVVLGEKTVVRCGFDAETLRFLGRRAFAVASALDGIPAGGVDPPIEEIQPYRPVWPRRLPIEAGIPSDLIHDRVLNASARLLYVHLWQQVPWSQRAPVVRTNYHELARSMGWKTYEPAKAGVRDLEIRGWVERCIDPDYRHVHMVTLALHQQRREKTGAGWVLADPEKDRAERAAGDGAQVTKTRRIRRRKKKCKTV